MSINCHYNNRVTFGKTIINKGFPEELNTALKKAMPEFDFLSQGKLLEITPTEGAFRRDDLTGRFDIHQAIRIEGSKEEKNIIQKIQYFARNHFLADHKFAELIPVETNEYTDDFIKSILRVSQSILDKVQF